LLGVCVDDWLQERQAMGKSLRTIARELWLETDQQIDVTGETLRRWLEEAGEPQEPDPPMPAQRAKAS
jgi:predicted metalloprotease with PDZ domain